MSILEGISVWVLVDQLGKEAGEDRRTAKTVKTSNNLLFLKWALLT